jgi:photosystem II stability/assembly factor-like uncharacterized protein
MPLRSPEASPGGTLDVVGAGTRNRTALLACLAALGGVFLAGFAARSRAVDQVGLPSSRFAAVLSARARTSAGERLTAIAFLNPRRGYGYFVRQGAVRCAARVGSTTDDGVIFRRLVPAGSWNCADSAPFQSLAFDGHGDGFLFGPGLAATHNGGRSWVQGVQLGRVLSVAAVEESIWMVEARCATPSAHACPLRLLESIDGGRTWSSASPAPPRVAGNPYGGGAQGQTWLVRTSRSSAYLLSNPVPNPKGLPDDAPLWFTSDGGSGWSRRSIPCHTDALSATLTVAPDGTLFAVCADQPSAGSQVKSALRSTDGGVRWTLESSCDLTGSASPSACASAPLNFGYLAGWSSPALVDRV